MWHREYQDYPIDTPIIQEKIEPSHGIIGCEMHEPDGWGNTFHIHLEKKKKRLLERFFAIWYKIKNSKLR